MRSLTSLAKYPASTVQILGAEKALFRSLKTRGNTPKYGLIFYSSFITRATPKNKGRIARYLANKCSLASRIDSFSEQISADATFGNTLKAQVEERLEFYKSGKPPRKNIDVMKEAIAHNVQVKEDSSQPSEVSEVKKEKKTKKKRKTAQIETETEVKIETEAKSKTPITMETEDKQTKAGKKHKKHKKAQVESTEQAEVIAEVPTPAPSKTKKKVKKLKNAASD